MKVILNITQFTTNEDYLIDTTLISNYLGYSLLKKTVGKHEVARRPHYHVMCIMEFTEGAEFEFDGKQKKSKIYKTLNKNIQEIISLSQYNNIKSHITFKYENGVGKPSISYDETALQYPFKEYIHYSKIPFAHCVGYTDEELISMWKCASTEWKRTQAIKKREEDKKAEETDKRFQLKEYIFTKINKVELQQEDYNFKVKTIITITLEFYKRNETRFRLTSLRDDAVNFLFHNNLLTEHEIVSHLYI